MRKLHIIGIILSLIPLPVLLYYLNSDKLIDWQLAVTLVFVEVPIGLLFHILTKDKTHSKNSEKESHSEKIGNALMIMGDGRYDEYLDKIDFLIPYPHSEYKEYERKVEFPTHSEIMELFNKRDWSDVEEKRYEFVPINKSPEGSFEQAWDHMKSYKYIKTLFEETRKNYEVLHIFMQKNRDGIKEINQKSWKLDNPESHPIYPQYYELLKNYSECEIKLKKSLKVLSQQLIDGKTIKGKCELGY